MNSPLLLDTCALIWLAERRLKPAALSLLAHSVAQGEPVWVSAISAWELGILVAHGRLHVALEPAQYFTTLLQFPGARLAALSPEVLIGSSFLPGRAPRDPADRILAATARHLNSTLMTRDRALLEYAAAGHLRSCEC